MNYSVSPRRYARMAKRFIRLATGNDVLYKLDLHPRKKHIGSLYGGWMILPDLLNAKSTVYSFGAGNDISFDLELIQKINLTVHSFDPSPPTVKWLMQQPLPENFQFHPWGLGNSDGEMTFYAHSTDGMYTLCNSPQNDYNHQVKVPIFSLSTILRDLNTPSIDLLKMDIEGTEYDVLADLIHSPVPIHQLMIEFHHRIGVKPLSATVESVNLLRDAGFKLFHVSETSSEFSFVHTGHSSGRVP